MSEMFDVRGGHIGEGELALYVLDALDPERRESVEAHVLSCEECSEGLAREARVEAALEQVARLADERASLAAVTLEARSAAWARGARPQLPHAILAAAEERARLASHAARRSRWAGGVAGALAAAAALVLAFASATAPRSESAGMSQRVPGLHDAAGDMSGALGAEVVMVDALDGG